MKNGDIFAKLRTDYKSRNSQHLVKFSRFWVDVREDMSSNRMVHFSYKRSDVKMSRNLA